MAFTNTGSAAVLNGLVGKANTAPLSSCYIALSTTTPSADGSNFTEPASSAGYARVLIGSYSQAATQVMTTPSNGETENSTIIFFPEATSSWGTVT